MKNKSHTKNNLWQARERAGLERKQVALLLSKNSTDEISRYERGAGLPHIKTALKFEIIYRMPVRLLFQELFENLQSGIDKIKKRHSQLFSGNDWFPPHAEQLKHGEACFYAEILKNRVPTEFELQTVVQHVTNLMNAVTEYKAGGNPFSLPVGNNERDSE